MTLFLLAVVPAAAAQESARQEPLFVSQPEFVAPKLRDAALTGAGPRAPDAPVEYRDVIIDGVLTSVQTRRSQGALPRVVIQVDPVADVLEGRFEAVGPEVSYLGVDGGELRSLDVSTGTFRSDGIVTAELAVREGAESAPLWLTAEEIAALAGTRLTQLPDGRLRFEPADTLAPTRDFDLWVNGRPVDAFGAEPRMVGSVLLLPLRAIVAELGHEIRGEPGAVEVIRVQDSKIVRLDLASGLVSVNGTPAGVTPDLALADLDELLVPYTAIEALTGAHISRDALSNRIRVDMGDRLDKSALPRARVATGVGHDPFTPEALSFQFSDRGPLRAEFSSRVDRYGSRLTYESAGGFERNEELQPSWASIDVQSHGGWAGSAGDYTTGRFRELSGVDVARIRGLSYRQQTENGDLLAIAAGTTLTDTEAVSDTATKPEFGGFAGGVRLLSEDGSQEIGASAKSANDGDTSAFVVSGQRVFDRSDQSGPLKTVHVAADAGYFDTVSGQSLDLRARAATQYQLTRQITAAISAYHDGEKFAETANPSKFEGVFDNRVGARTGGSVSADWRSAESWGLLQFVSVGGRASVEQIGGSDEATSTRLQAGLTTRIGANGPVVAIDADHIDVDFAGQVEPSDRIQIRAVQTVDWGVVQARYVAEEGDATDREFVVISAQGNPLKKSFGDDAFASIAPTANVGWIDSKAAVRAGASAAFSTGRKLGDRLVLDGQVFALSSVDPDDFGTRYFADMRARYRVDARTELVARLVDDLDGRSDLSFALRGTIIFNEPRKPSPPLSDQSAISGAVFVDQNHDSLRQTYEPGLRGPEVEVRGTEFKLEANGEGKFDGRNLSEGVTAMSVTRASLPLGYRPTDAAVREATISQGRPAARNLPVARKIELRGAVFIDLNKDGVAGVGDQRLEGQLVQIIDPTFGDIDEVNSGAFGQFGFRDMAPGTYRLRVMIGWQEYAVDIEIGEDDAVETAAIAIPPEVLGLTAQYRAETGPGDDKAA
ncbi:MAG: hypothetical protein RLN70_12305 [Rhodospirillaceae bacterium]